MASRRCVSSLTRVVRVSARCEASVAATLLRPHVAVAAPRPAAAAPRRMMATNSTVAPTRGGCPFRGMAASSSPSSRGEPNPYANAPALSAAQLAVIKQTVPVLAEHGLTLTTNFYKKMLSKHPELNNIFNHAHQATGMQPKALASAVYAYASHIDNLGVLGPAVALMAHKHCSLSVVPSQYPIVGENLLATLRELLLSAKFPEATVAAVIDAWGVAYGQLANLLITEEEKLYRSTESAPGGWRGWRTFVVSRIESETQAPVHTSSFYFTPKDGGAVPSYLPGQFTTINFPVTFDNGVTYTQPRQYSLSQSSERDGKGFRITVKREDDRSQSGGGPAGRVSTSLHGLKVGDEVQLAPPYGSFTLDTKAKTPVVLLGAGVGITPLVSMAETARAAGRQVSFMYACDTGRAHPLRTWLRQQNAAAATEAKGDAAKLFSSHVWYRTPEAGVDVLGRDYQAAGLMDLTSVPAAQALPRDADYYVCGPSAFMTQQLTALRQLGVAPAKLHAEAFGSGDVHFPA